MRSTSRFFRRTGVLCAAAVAIASMAASGSGLRTERSAQSDPVGVTAHLARVPLSFEPNRGQAEAGVDAVARGSGYTLLLSRGDATLIPANGAISERNSAPAGALRIKLKVSQATVRATEEGELPGRTNYFLGNDPAKWRTDIPNYERVRYAGIYPGIDLVYYGNGRGLEHDFAVAPGADPARIRFSIAGAGNVRLDSRSGDLVLAQNSGELRLRKPAAYQTIGGKRIAVDSHYMLAEGGEAGFRLGKYDRGAPLVIDPELSFSTLVPPISNGPIAVAVDAKGCSYLTGTYLSATGGGYDVAVYKLTPGGSALVYTSIFGGSGYDHGTAIAVDVYGNAYVTGDTGSADFPTKNAFQSTPAGTFVTKLNPAGNVLLYSTYLGGGEETAYGIAVDTSQRAFVTGATSSPKFPTHLPLQAALKGESDVYVTAFSLSGSTVLYSTYLGGSGNDLPAGIALDPTSNVYIAGTTTSTDFPLANALQARNKNIQASFLPGTGFVAKIYGTGSHLDYSTYLGGSLGEIVGGIAVDSSGNAYVAGETSSPDFPVANALQPSGGPLMGTVAPECEANLYYNTAFVSKFNAAGSALVYSTYLGPIEANDNFPWGSECDGYFPLENGATGIAVDSSGDAVVTGFTYSFNFPVTQGGGSNPGAYSNCASSAFVTRFNPAGSALLFSGYFGGYAKSGDEELICTGTGGTTASGVAVDPLGSAYIVGPPNTSTDFPLTATAYETNFYGHYQWSYEAKFAFAPMAQTTTSLTAPYAAIDGSNTAILSAQVKPAAAGGPIPTGSVNFLANGSPIGTATLNAQGIATLQYTFPTPNSYTIQASYSGNIDTDASSASLTQGFGIASTPAIAPIGGTYHSEPKITLDDRLAGATIHYTLNGAAPTETSPVYTAPFVLAQSATVRAIAVTPQLAPSAVATASYVIDTPAATPTFSVPAGTYATAQTVKIVDSTAGAAIYYTLNGANPTAASAKYSAAIKVGASETIKAIAVAAGHEASAVASAAYKIE